MRPVFTRSFAQSIFLAGRGYEPERVEFDGDGTVIYYWPPEAKQALDEFYQIKSRLNGLAMAAGRAR